MLGVPTVITSGRLAHLHRPICVVALPTHSTRKLAVSRSNEPGDDLSDTITPALSDSRSPRQASTAATRGDTSPRPLTTLRQSPAIGTASEPLSDAGRRGAAPGAGATRRTRTRTAGRTQRLSGSGHDFPSIFPPASMNRLTRADRFTRSADAERRRCSQALALALALALEELLAPCSSQGG